MDTRSVLVELKRKAKAIGLWNLFLPVDSAAAANTNLGAGLTNRQYGEICEILGTSVPAEFASQATNCTSPDTGNMEVLARYGTTAQKQKWLRPLLDGTIRSAYAMTEPGNDNNLGSSDATNMSIRVERDEKTNEYVINGSKWWITGAGSLHCKIMILMGKLTQMLPVMGQLARFWFQWIHLELLFCARCKHLGKTMLQKDILRLFSRIVAFRSKM